MGITSALPSRLYLERFRCDSACAQANGDAEILAAGTAPLFLVEEYAASAEHTFAALGEVDPCFRTSR